MDKEEQKCKHREYMQQYYHRPEVRPKVRAAQASYYQRNKERIKEQARKYQKEHKEEQKLYHREWRNRNREHWNETQNTRWHRRRARLNSAAQEAIDLDCLYKRDRKYCGICGKPVKRKQASIDHIIPISKGGSHTYDNVQLAHRQCNYRRGIGRIPAQTRLNLKLAETHED